jgi:hypothetical protein
VLDATDDGLEDGSAVAPLTCLASASSLRLSNLLTRCRLLRRGAWEYSSGSFCIATESDLALDKFLRAALVCRWATGGLAAMVGARLEVVSRWVLLGLLLG